MLFDVILMHVMQMTIVEIIDMAVMLYRRVPTVRTMLMSMVPMVLLIARNHGLPLSSRDRASTPWTCDCLFFVQRCGKAKHLEQLTYVSIGAADEARITLCPSRFGHLANSAPQRPAE